MENSLALKMKETLSFVIMQINLEDVVLRDRSSTQTGQCPMVLNSQEWDQQGRTREMDTGGERH